jgi:hypothetical protein
MVYIYRFSRLHISGGPNARLRDLYKIVVHGCGNFGVRKAEFFPHAIMRHAAKTSGGMQVQLHVCLRDQQKPWVHCGGKWKEFIVQEQAYKIVIVLQWGTRIVWLSVLRTGNYSVLMSQYCALAATGCWCFRTVHWQLQGVDVSVLRTGSYRVLMFQYLHWQLQCVDVSVLCTGSYSVLMFSVI